MINLVKDKQTSSVQASQQAICKHRVAPANDERTLCILRDVYNVSRTKKTRKM